MVRSRNLLRLVPFLALSPVAADHVGSGYLPPTDLTSDDSLVSQAWQNFSSKLGDYIQARKGAGSAEEVLKTLQTDPLQLTWNITFSMNMFSIYDEKTVEDLQFHHVSRELARSKYGTRKVSGDSIYRVQSVSKAITAYAAMMHFEPEDWERPLIKIFPELKNATADSFPVPDWEEITPIALAAQIAGISPAIPLFATYPLQEAAGIAQGLPPLDPKTDPIWSKIPCDISVPCGLNDANKFVQSLAVLPRVFSPWTSPNYANTGYILFGQVFAKLLGKNATDVIASDIFKPLGMANSRTHGLKPKELSKAVIPTEDETMAWMMYKGDGELTSPSGGVLSTTNDLAKLGISILNNTLLTPSRTRKWMKPRSHSARLDYSIGAPWEIPRYKNPKTGVVTDIYTKAGDGFSATAMFILLPEFGVGFSLLSANEVDTVRNLVVGAIGDLLTETLIPALSEQAAVETESKFGGTYKATGDLDSSLTFAVNKTEGASPGLRITNFVSNGTDVLKANPGLATRLVAVTSEGDQVTMEALTEIDAPNLPSLFVNSFNGADWIVAGGSPWGGIQQGLFVFDVDESGNAKDVKPLAYRAKLERQKE
ncbi:beta-lactamase/transpeptidase-like protein [Thelonectria olida]|uniref:Beta-lactamase/transpeptidase-like protein n=1 Tax=Thelonectria olida TaxID=1576542 RepID=A0A9P9AGR1_9HYPO|nr:beta-lactamase/transpeptidase-like protein [Thelonectria olida]